jgi:hypothetical protein
MAVGALHQYGFPLTLLRVRFAVGMDGAGEFAVDLADGLGHPLLLGLLSRRAGELLG